MRDLGFDFAKVLDIDEKRYVVRMMEFLRIYFGYVDYIRKVNELGMRFFYSFIPSNKEFFCLCISPEQFEISNQYAKGAGFYA